MEQVILYSFIYLATAVLFLLINAVMAGYLGQEINKDDYMGSLLWPVEIMILIGGLIRLIKNTGDK